MWVPKEYSVLKHAVWLLWYLVSWDEQEKVLEVFFSLLFLHNHALPSTLCSDTQGNQVYSGFSQGVTFKPAFIGPFSESCVSIGSGDKICLKCQENYMLKGWVGLLHSVLHF